MIPKELLTHPHHAVFQDPAYEEWLNHTSVYPTEEELEKMETSFHLFSIVPIPANTLNYNPKQGA